jgi:SAM-dependent MidA family methyltransferase
MLREAITNAGGWITFARFMELALYAPGLGYYAAGARKFGPDGDFVTAPEISALFGQCLARTVGNVLSQTGGDVLELGPGSGKLAADMLPALEALGRLPDRYLMLEVSADLRQRQQQALAALPVHLAARAVWIDAIPEEFTGCVVANEVLDVVPVHLVRFAAGWVFERGVTLKDGRFEWQDVPALPAELAAPVGKIQAECLDGAPPEGYCTEVSPAAAGLVSSLARSLLAGAILFVDYGFRAAEFYHPSRESGTLMCHYRHYAHSDPFLYPGLQDITAHVDFSAAARAGMDAGLSVAGYTTQAQFLLASGLTQLVSSVDPSDVMRYLPLTNQLQRLISPAEMGEFFKVLCLVRDELPLPAFASARPLPL